MDDKEHKAILLFFEFQILGAKNPKVQPSGKGKDLIRKYVIKLE